MLDAKAWKVTTEKNSPDCVYQMQVYGITPALRSKVEKVLSEWDIVGEGSKKGKQVLIFSRNFKEQSRWLKWAKSFGAFNLVELDKNGEPKKYVKIGVKASNAVEIKDTSGKGKRRCGKCGQTGHNARTCRGEKAPEKVVSQPVVKPQAQTKGKYRCGKCGEAGHNARSCEANLSSKKKSKKPVNKTGTGKYRCGKCGGLGHNARTCK